MTRFEPRTSGIGSDRSTNWATTTAQQIILYNYNKLFFQYLANYNIENLSNN